MISRIPGAPRDPNDVGPRAMSDLVPLDVVERFLLGAGFSVDEVLWADRRLHARPVAEATFWLMRRHMLTRGGNEVSADRWNYFEQTRTTIRGRRQRCLQRITNVGVAICGLPCFVNHRHLVGEVLRFLIPSGVSRKTFCVCRCLAPGCSTYVTASGIEDFLDHLEASHLDMVSPSPEPCAMQADQKGGSIGTLGHA